MPLFGVWDDDPELSDEERLQRRAAEALASFRVIAKAAESVVSDLGPIADSYIAWFLDELGISDDQYRTAMLDLQARIAEERVT